jgi:hypothetical protein
LEAADCPEAAIKILTVAYNEDSSHSLKLLSYSINVAAYISVKVLKYAEQFVP